MILAVFFFPLALYLLALGLVNCRRRPLLVPATWDFAGVLFAASGLLAFVAPLVLNALSVHWHVRWVLGRTRIAPADSAGSHGLWQGVWLAYFLGVLLVVALVLRARRGQTAAYNVRTDAFEEVLGGVLNRLGLSWNRSGTRYFLQRTPAPGPAPGSFHEALGAGSSGRATELMEPRRLEDAGADVPDSPGVLELEPSPRLRHVTLSWNDAGCENYRREVERELARAVRHVETTSNPVGFWLLWAGTLLMMVNVLLTATVLYVLLRGR